MTTLKMIIAVLGSLIFLGIFSAGFNTAQHQETTAESCTSSTNIQEVSLVNFTCLTAKNTHSARKG
jgi:hypothetical protein